MPFRRSVPQSAVRCGAAASATPPRTWRSSPSTGSDCARRSSAAACAGSFDLIIVQEAFEHLHAPCRMAEYLLDHLNPGGVFAFDYIRKDDELGHDTPAGMHERIDTLAYLARELDIRHGVLRVGLDTVSLCAGARRRAGGRTA